MKIYAYIGNPIVKTQDDYNELDAEIKANYPLLEQVHIKPDKLVIMNMGRKSFNYPKIPSLKWLIGRLKYMYENNL